MKPKQKGRCKGKRKIYPDFVAPDFVELATSQTAHFHYVMNPVYRSRLGIDSSDIEQFANIAKLNAAVAHKSDGPASLNTLATVCITNQMLVLAKRACIEKYTMFTYCSETYDYRVDELDPERRLILLEDIKDSLIGIDKNDRKHFEEAARSYQTG